MNTMTPTRKVGAGALAGALSVIIIWVVVAFGGIDVTPEVASAFTVVLTFFVSYYVPEKDA